MRAACPNPKAYEDAMLALQSLDKCSHLLINRANLICTDFTHYDSSDSEEIFTDYWDDIDWSSEEAYDLPEEELMTLRRRKRLMDMKIMKRLNDYIIGLMDDIHLSIYNTLPENRSDWYFEMSPGRIGPFEWRCPWIHYHVIKYHRDDSPNPIDILPIIEQ